MASPVQEMSNLLAYFVKNKVYSYVDKLSRPFSYDDVIRAVADALRHAKAIKSSDPKEPVEIPSSKSVEKFLEQCKHDLNVARKAAILALAEP
jgi:hypothetical protein